MTIALTSSSLEVTIAEEQGPSRHADFVLGSVANVVSGTVISASGDRMPIQITVDNYRVVPLNMTFGVAIPELTLEEEMDVWEIEARGALDDFSPDA